MRNLMRPMAAAIVAAFFLLAVAACGGNDSTESSSESAAAVEQINTICDDWKATRDARGEFPIDGFDPEAPSADDLPAVGNYFASGFDANQEAITAIDELPVPAEIQSQTDALVGALENELESARKQATAAQAGDVDAFKATLEPAAASQEAVEAAADDLGASSCAF